MSRADSTRGAHRARLHVALTAGPVVLYIASMQLLLPDPTQRSATHYSVVIALGYGHLIGAWLSASKNASSPSESAGRQRARALRTTGQAALLFCLYGIALGLWPAVVVVPLLTISTWHSVENEWALRSAYRLGSRLPPLTHSIRVRLATLALTALLLLTAGGTLGREDLAQLLPLSIAESLPNRPLAPLCFGDVFAASTLFHLLSWLVFLLQRERIGGERKRVKGERERTRGERVRVRGAASGAPLSRLLLWTHAPPALVCATLLALPEHVAPLLREVVFSPTIYLFWSTLHVVQTVITRQRAAAQMALRTTPSPVPIEPRPAVLR